MSAVLEPGRPPKTDKATILSDAVRILGQLRSEAQQLQDSNNQLHDAIKELKVQLPLENPHIHASFSLTPSTTFPWVRNEPMCGSFCLVLCIVSLISVTMSVFPLVVC